MITATRRRLATVGLTTLGAIGASTLLGCANAETSSRTPRPPAPRPFAVVDNQIRPAPAIAMGDAATVRRIVREGQRNNQAITHLTELCETFGPRLTGSTAADDAGKWAKDKFASWGLDKARLDWWGDIATRFDRGPSTGVAYLRIESESDDGETEVEWDSIRDLEFTTLAWTRGTDGPVRGRVLQMPTDETELALVQDQIPGSWLLIAPDYSGRAGVRSSGFLMRQRLEQRHQLRAEETPDTEPAHVAQSDPGPDDNTWTGTFDYHGSPVPVTLQIDVSEGGEVTGTQAITGFSTGPISDGVFDKSTGKLTYKWKHAMGTSSIELNRDADSMTGKSVNASGVEFAMNLTRTATIQPEPTDESESIETSSVLARVLRLDPAGFISSSRDERVWTTSANGWREREFENYPIDIEVNVRESDYDFLNSRVADGAPIHVEFDLDHGLTAGPIPCYNVIAEIPGSEKPEEVVIVSAHLDSWNGPGSQGTVDNGTGASVVMEAARILAEVGAEPKRTIRFILWTGEEQGLLGSRAYVANLPQDELDRISAVFVDDGGTNSQGGAPAADYMVDYLAAASAPTNGAFFSQADYDRAMSDDDPDNDASAGWLLVNIRPTGDKINTHSGSDHAAFNAVGVPGFFWDEVGRANYRHAWHTQNDRLDQAIVEYLAQSSTNMAVVAYNLACAPDLLPRRAPGADDAAESQRESEPESVQPVPAG